MISTRNSPFLLYTLCNRTWHELSIHKGKEGKREKLIFIKEKKNIYLNWRMESLESFSSIWTLCYWREQRAFLNEDADEADALPSFFIQVLRISLCHRYFVVVVVVGRFSLSWFDLLTDWWKTKTKGKCLFLSFIVVLFLFSLLLLPSLSLTALDNFLSLLPASPLSKHVVWFAHTCTLLDRQCS